MTWRRGVIERLAPLYRRGYIKNYALLIGLDPAPPCWQPPGAGRTAPGLTEVLRRFGVQDSGSTDTLKVATYLIVTTVYCSSASHNLSAQRGEFCSSRSEKPVQATGVNPGISSFPPLQSQGADSREVAGDQARHVSAFRVAIGCHPPAAGESADSSVPSTAPDTAANCARSDGATV